MRPSDLGLSKNEAGLSIVFHHFEKRGGEGSEKGTNQRAKLMNLENYSHCMYNERITITRYIPLIPRGWLSGV